MEPFRSLLNHLNAVGLRLEGNTLHISALLRASPHLGSQSIYNVGFGFPTIGDSSLVTQLHHSNL